MINNKILLNVINKSIDLGTPLSVIRKGDGDNVLIGFNKIKGIKLSKYLKKLKHFNIRRYDIKFQKYFISELIKACDDADYLGIAKDDSYSSIRKYEPDIIKYYKWGNKKLFDSHFHLEFVKNPKNNNLQNSLAQKVISNKKIGIISHLDLASFLKEHNSEVVEQISIPKRNAGIFNKMDANTYLNIVNLISSSSKVIDVWLVAAGAYAKPFCYYLKKNNYIALDLGSALHTWLGDYGSRKFLKEIIDVNEQK